MSLFSDNIKYLRVNLNVTQRIVAEKINISRDRYAKYEDGVNEPSIEILLSLSRYHQISIDILVAVDIRKIASKNLFKVGDNRILLPITVDKEGNNNNNIELITEKVKAGYLNGYADPEFIGSLQHLVLPFLGKGKYRGFPIEGDSMPPHEDGSFIVGSFIESLQDIIFGKTYILLTKNDGIVYKRVDDYKKNYLNVKSDNPFYPPYKIASSEILEIWEYKCSIGRNDKNYQPYIPTAIQELLLKLIQEIKQTRD